MLLTETMFFDTDCLSAFLWVNNQSLLAQLYPGRIVIPAEVYTELSIPTVPHLKKRIDKMISVGVAKIETIQVGTEEYRLYRKLVSSPDEGHKIIDKGEAAAISMVKKRGGILASNNLKDVSEYVEEFNLKHMTTGEILKEALNKGLITENEGNNLWQSMLNKHRKLGYASFTEFLQSNS